MTRVRDGLCGVVTLNNADAAALAVPSEAIDEDAVAEAFTVMGVLTLTDALADALAFEVVIADAEDEALCEVDTCIVLQRYQCRPF